MDSRLRKMIIGDINGNIKVYNPMNGAIMKSCVDTMDCAVQQLLYVNDDSRFIAGYENGHIRVYDESHIDDCMLLRTFDSFNIHKDLISMYYCAADKTLASSSSSENTIKFWYNITNIYIYI